jgi:hypothetical protein
MGQILVRNLDDDIIERLKAKATDRGTSLEQFVRDALAEAAGRVDRAAWLARLDALRAGAAADPGWSASAEIRAARDALAQRLDRAGPPAGSRSA